MKRELLTLLCAFTLLTAAARHYDLTARRLSTADGLPSNVVARLWQDETGYIWFSTLNGVCRYDGYAFHPADSIMPVAPQRSLVLQTLDASWQRQGQGRLTRIGNDGSQRSWQLIPPEIIGYTRNDHFHVADVDDRTEAVSTYGSGLFLYDKPSGELTQLTKENSRGIISDNYLTGLLVDRTGCIWVIEDYLGVKCLRMNSLRYDLMWLNPMATVQDENHVRCIAPWSSNSLLIANQTGHVYAFNFTTDSLQAATTESHRLYAALLDSQGRQWTGTRGNGLWLDGSKADGLPSPHIFNIRESSKGHIIVSMLEGGVTEILPDGRQRHFLGRHNVHDALATDDDRLWAATEESLYLLSQQRMLLDSLGGRFVCLYTDSQRQVWAGSTNKGLVRVGTDDNRITANYYDSHNGLANNGVYSLVEDGQRRLWIGTEDGLSRLDPVTGDIQNYHISDNQLANVFSERSATTLPDGRLLFGTRNGLVSVSPEADKTVAPSQTVITGILVNGESIVPDKAGQLTYQQNNVTFLFSNFNYMRIESIRYQYQLDGYDTEWTQPTSGHDAVYRNLPPGNYTFRVRSGSDGGEWTAETAIGIHIGQPWWNTWWAWAAYLLIATVGGWFVFRLQSLRRTLDVERQVAAFKADFYNRIERELKNPISVVHGATENVKLAGTTKTTVQSLRRGSRRLLKLMEMMVQFNKGEDLGRGEDIDRRFRQIVDSIHAGEPELLELAPPPINEHTVLIMEEDKDSLSHLTDTLNSYFRVMGCQTLADCMDVITAQQPSVLLIDITADEKGCLELTRRLHQEKPSLPVIHLSSFCDDAHQLRSLRSGAADYLTKPFSGKILLERISRIIEMTRDRATEATSSESVTSSDTPILQGLLKDPKDKRFLDLFQVVLSQHIADENFSVEQFAELMHLGRTQFYKRVKTLTGETPVQHIHRARLDYAARLLRESQMTVEEVMNRSGFNSPTHFYNSFKKQFGMSPRALRDSDL